MKGFIKMIIAGSVILGIGIVVLVFALGLNHWQLDEDYEMKDYECAEENTTLDIDFSAGTLDINYYDGDKIKIEYPESETWTASISEVNGTLSFATEHKRKWNNFSNWFSKIPTTKIWIPQGDIMNVDLNMNAGTVKLADGGYGNLDITMNAGTFSTGEVDCKKLSVKLNAGTISAQKIDSVEEASIKMNAGSINIHYLVCPSIVSKLSAGSLNISKLQTASVDVNLSAGSVKLVMTGAKSDYDIDVDKSAGSCNISNQRGTKGMSIKAGISAGSLTVKFES
ncbi:MAG: DUF4097 domain-containing protein [Clostridia bacterium]|nr:DUF4097 domain-containing protein [Clostridia bacterium]